MVVGMDLIIAAAIDADHFTTQFLYLFGGAFIGFTIPEVLGANHGDANGLPLERKGFCG